LKKTDKVCLLVILPAVDGFRVSAREFDVRTQRWSTPSQVTARQVAGLGDACLWAVRRAFAPLARVLSVEDRAVTLRLRAAALGARDPSFAVVRPGQVFLPVLRAEDRKGTLKGLAPVIWTFLSAEKMKGSDVQCTLHSGLRTPLSSRRRGRVQQLALAVIPPEKPSTLVLKARTDDKRLLAGYDVYGHYPGEKSAELLGRTDIRGELRVPPGKSPLRLLLVKHGGQLLARLPVVPGLEPVLTAAVADDDQRLEAEGYLAGFQDELIDLVTSREVLLARARARIEAGDLAAAEALLSELRGLKSRDQFARQLAAQKQKSVSKDPVVQKKIDAMFDETEKLLKQYLDPAVVERLTAEVTKARAAGPPAVQPSRTVQPAAVQAPAVQPPPAAQPAPPVQPPPAVQPQPARSP